VSRQLLTVSPDEPGGHRTIEEALAAARTGSVIRIPPGRYAESLVIRTRISYSFVRSAGVPRHEGVTWLLTYRVSLTY
jgi:hypothetical protein